MKRLLVVFLVVLASACSTTEPIIKTEIQLVEIPIPVACKVDEPKRPVFNFDNLTEDKDIFDKVKALLADKKLHKAYEEELVAALKSCK